MALVGNLKVLFSADTAGLSKGAAASVKSLRTVRAETDKLKTSFKTGFKSAFTDLKLGAIRAKEGIADVRRALRGLRGAGGSVGLRVGNTGTRQAGTASALAEGAVLASAASGIGRSLAGPLKSVGGPLRKAFAEILKTLKEGVAGITKGAESARDVAVSVAHVFARFQVPTFAGVVTDAREAQHALEDLREEISLLAKLKKVWPDLREGLVKVRQGSGLAVKGVAKLALGIAKLGSRAVIGVLKGIAGLVGKIFRGIFSFKGLLAGAGIGGLVAGIVKAGSDLNEEVSAAGATFGRSSNIVVAAARRQAKAFGTVKSEYLEVANGIGSIAKASGLAAPEAAQLTVQLTDMAADLASFRNLSFKEAAEKIRSGLVGEAEPLRTVGVLLSAAAVEQEAYTSGLAKMGSQLTEGQKVLARSQITMRQLADAQGDLARTANGPANQMRAIRGRIINLAADFGRAVQPITQAILGGIGSAIIKLGGKFELASGNINEWAQRAVADGGIVNQAIKGVGRFVGRVADAFLSFGKTALKVLVQVARGAEAIATPLSYVLKPITMAVEGFRMLAAVAWNGLDGLNSLGKGEGAVSGELQQALNTLEQIRPVGADIAKAFEEIASGAAQSSKAIAQNATAMDPVGSKTLELTKDIDDFNSKIKEQVRYFGMSDKGVELAKLRDRGATPEQLRTAAAGVLKLQQMEDWKARQETLAGQVEERRKDPFGGLNTVGSRSAYEAEVRARSPRSDELQRRAARAGEGAVKLLAEIKAILAREPQRPAVAAGVVRG